MFSARELSSLITTVILLVQEVSAFNNHYNQAVNSLTTLSTETIIGIAVAGSLFVVGLIAFALLWYFAEKLGITCLTGNGPKRRTATQPVTKVQPSSVTVVTTTTSQHHPGSYENQQQYHGAPPQPVHPAPASVTVQPGYNDTQNMYPPPGYIP